MSSAMLYERLADHRSRLLGAKSWVGNLRWVAQEAVQPLAFTFHTCPVGPEEAEYSPGTPGSPVPRARRTLFTMAVDEAGPITGCTYRADGMAVASAQVSFALCLPLQRYGALIRLTPKNSGAPVRLVFDHSIQAGRRPVKAAAIVFDVQPGRVVCRDGAYVWVLRHDGRVEQQRARSTSTKTRPSRKRRRCSLTRSGPRPKAVTPGRRTWVRVRSRALTRIIATSIASWTRR